MRVNYEYILHITIVYIFVDYFHVPLLLKNIYFSGWLIKIKNYNDKCKFL